MVHERAPDQMLFGARLNIAERLREERIRLELSQTEFAALGGVQKRSQINYESGERLPDAGYLASIASAGVDVAYVLTGIRVQSPPPALSSEESSLIADYKGSSPGDRAAIRQLAKSVSKAPTISGTGIGRRRAAGGSK